MKRSLVRHKRPEIRPDGPGHYVDYDPDRDDYRALLIAKLGEEVMELIYACAASEWAGDDRPDISKEILDECADVVEVVRTIAMCTGGHLTGDLIAHTDAKRSVEGGFMDPQIYELY